MARKAALTCTFAYQTVRAGTTQNGLLIRRFRVRIPGGAPPDQRFYGQVDVMQGSRVGKR